MCAIFQFSAPLHFLVIYSYIQKHLLNPWLYSSPLGYINEQNKYFYHFVVYIPEEQKTNIEFK